MSRTSLSKREKELIHRVAVEFGLPPRVPRKQVQYAPSREIVGELDPARAIMCAVMYRAVMDWRNVKRGRMFDSEAFWPISEWHAIGIDDRVSELLDFFHSREFDGMCDWLDMDRGAVLAALGVR